MELSYKNNKLKKSLTTDKGIAKGYGTIAKKVKLRITQLNNADNLEVISKLQVLRLHQHIGKGTWSIDIQENWRILFEINQDPIPTLEDGGIDLKAITIISIESVEDPH
ncbi:killer suppression protein HigA [Psychroflexus sp. MES1-P1E]|uniref:killer suppression protein HigA n=1 Tax=Psychroflexus sp. MES1-P1E TaxID=2058320 RepID=UPI000C7B5BFF|nr:killer suppression protein HigA [Psychroflexus sp. MES1-P1E]PKG41465.1 killer suppression protein HigA [Psychroflexus sp. MES1-P1E]